MLGVFVGLLIAGITYLTSGSGTLAYQNGVVFLHGYWVVTTILLAILFIIVAVVIPLFAGKVFGETAGVLGGLIGLLGGGVISGILLVWFVIARGALILGTTLLIQALTITSDGATWDNQKLIFGGILVLVGILFNQNSSSSNKESKK